MPEMSGLRRQLTHSYTCLLAHSTSFYACVPSYAPARRLTHAVARVNTSNRLSRCRLLMPSTSQDRPVPRPELEDSGSAL